MKKFDVDILEDGTVRVSTDDLSGIHHASADEFLRQIQHELGGAVEVKNKRKSLHHHHHEHSHGNHTHTH